MRPSALLLAAATALGCGAPPLPAPTPAAAIATRARPAPRAGAPTPAAPTPLEMAPRAHIAIRGGGLADVAPAEAAEIRRRIADALGAHPALTCDARRAAELGLDRYAIDVDANLARLTGGRGADAEVEMSLTISSPEDRLLTIWRRRARVLGAPGASTDRELWNLALDSVLEGVADHVAGVVAGPRTAEHEPCYERRPWSAACASASSATSSTSLSAASPRSRGPATSLTSRPLGSSRGAAAASPFISW